MDSTTDPHEALAQAWATGVAYFEVRPPNTSIEVEKVDILEHNTRSEQVVSTSNQSPSRSENFRQNRQDER